MPPKAVEATAAEEEPPPGSPEPETPEPIDPVIAFQRAAELQRLLELRCRKVAMIRAHGESSLQLLQAESGALANPIKCCTHRLGTTESVSARRAKTDKHLSYIVSPRRQYPRELPEIWPAKGARAHLTSSRRRLLERAPSGDEESAVGVLGETRQDMLATFGSLRSGYEDWERDRVDHQADVSEDLEAIRGMPRQEAAAATQQLLLELQAVEEQLTAIREDRATLGFPNFYGPRQRPPGYVVKGVNFEGPDEIEKRAQLLEEKALERWRTNQNLVQELRKEGARAFHSSLLPLGTWGTNPALSARLGRHKFELSGRNIVGAL